MIERMCSAMYEDFAARFALVLIEEGFSARYILPIAVGHSMLTNIGTIISFYCHISLFERSW